VEPHPRKTRIVHVAHGFEFLGFKIKRGKQLSLSAGKIRSRARSGALYAYPKEKSIRRFKDRVRERTKRRIPLRACELIEEPNPLLRGWGEYYKKAHVRKLFHPKSGSRAARLMAELPDNVRDGENGDGCSPSPGG